MSGRRHRSLLLHNERLERLATPEEISRITRQERAAPPAARMLLPVAAAFRRTGLRNGIQVGASAARSILPGTSGRKRMQ